MKTKICFLLIAFCCFGVNVFSQYEHLEMRMANGTALFGRSTGEIQTFPTFIGCSYYFHTPDNLPGDTVFRVEYKPAGETGWRAAHATVCDQPEKIHKGSLFNLDEDTEYQIRVFSDSLVGPEYRHDNTIIAQTAFRTWTSSPHIAKTIDLSTLPDTAQNGIVITEQGTPDAWIKYTAPAGWVVKRTLRDADRQEAVIVLRGAKYVILENLTLEGGKLHGIFVDNCDFVRILNCEISGWGRTGVQQFMNDGRTGQYKDVDGRVINYDGGIQIRRSFGTVVERCYIHDPRGRANSWVFSHPTGPEAIVADFTRGGNVIRWNDFVGSDEHRWNDVIEGQGNDSPQGGLYRDSDIIGNYLAFGNDDGIELEGGGINLRFIGNKIEGTLCGISFGACMIGPQYAVGNLIVNLGDEEGLALNFLKNSHGTEQKGKRFIYNNTFHGNATAYGGYGGATPTDAGLGTMRNNIFACNESSRPGEWARADHFDNDLFWVNGSPTASEGFVASFRRYGQEMNALTANPQFADSAAGNYRLSPDSIAHGKSVEVGGLTQAGDQLGAFFNGVTDIPYRPFVLTAKPDQVNFDASGGNTDVTLRLPADAAESVAFQIRQNLVFDWFTVTPAQGTIAPGETLKLTVTVDPAKITGRPVFRGAFLVRTPSGLSRPVAVYAKGDYVVDKRPASAGPNTVYIDGKSGAVDTQINIPTDGVYSLLVRLSPSTPQGGRRGFDLSLNDKTSSATAESGYWYLRNGGDQILWLYSLGELQAGTNRISIKPADPNLKDVEYIVTDNPTVFFTQERNARR